MSALERAERYLTIPPLYGADLGGLWWSSRRDAIERLDGTTLAVADEVRTVLDGVLAHPAAPAFAFVLNALDLMKTGAGTGFHRLSAAYAQTRGVAARGRNVGLLIARLCRNLPWVPGAIKPDDVAVVLRSIRLYGTHVRPEAVEEPPLTRFEFEAYLANILAHYDDARLVHWLTHGCSPSQGGAQLAEQAESLPDRLTRLLKLARRRARLAGAASLVPALDAALTLPPRGRPPEALPLGGYCDVTTRGDPERLLPAQFALAPDEFVRRFAASELLYFKREEPHDAVRPERVVVLDQGVRTWGSVRLALAAAALSLLRVDAKRSGPARLFVTSAGGMVDLLDPNPDLVADRLEASDLSANPGPHLESVMQAGEGEPRDVILLTHPRNLREPGVLALAPPRGHPDRLFAVAVDDAGRAELAQLAAGSATAVRSFRVDLEAAEAVRPEGDAPPSRPQTVPSEPLSSWSGDVEPVPFPFRPGVIGEPQFFGFAADGDRLVTAAANGTLHALAFDGTAPEVLPRPFRHGAVLRQVDAVLGVTGGAVVCGRMTVSDTPTVEAPAPQSVTLHTPGSPVATSGASEPPTEQFVAAHYDFATRHLTLHTLGPATTNAPQWSAHPELHCVALRTPAGTGCALDLATRGQFPGPSPLKLVSRALLAWDQSAKPVPPFDLPILDTLPNANSATWNVPFLHRPGGSPPHLWQPPRAISRLAPQRDGKPLLARAEVRRAALAGDVLALSYANAGERNLLLLRGSDTVLGDLPHPLRNAFGLSADGRFLARCDAAHALVVSETSEPARPVATATHAALHTAVSIDIQTRPFSITIAVGGYRHAFLVDRGVLWYKPWWEVPPDRLPVGSAVRHAPTDYDSTRFPLRQTVRAGNWCVVFDKLGQVLLFNHPGSLVAAFLVRRELAAAWIPGGVFWGDARLIGGPASPDAARKIGQAIVNAEGS